MERGAFTRAQQGEKSKQVGVKKKKSILNRLVCIQRSMRHAQMFIFMSYLCPRQKRELLFNVLAQLGCGRLILPKASMSSTLACLGAATSASCRKPQNETSTVRHNLPSWAHFYLFSLGPWSAFWNTSAPFWRYLIVPRCLLATCEHYIIMQKPYGPKSNTVVCENREHSRTITAQSDKLVRFGFIGVWNGNHQSGCIAHVVARTRMTRRRQYHICFVWVAWPS